MALELKMVGDDVVADGVDIKRTSRNLMRLFKGDKPPRLDSIEAAMDLVARTLGLPDSRAARQTAKNSRPDGSVGATLNTEQLCELFAMTAGFAADDQVALFIDAARDEEEEADDKGSGDIEFTNSGFILSIHFHDDGAMTSHCVMTFPSTLEAHHSHTDARFEIPCLLAANLAIYMSEHDFVMRLARAYKTCLNASLAAYGLDAPLPNANGPFITAFLGVLPNLDIKAIPNSGVVLPSFMIATPDEAGYFGC
jgi:hypothetical protein